MKVIEISSKVEDLLDLKHVRLISTLMRIAKDQRKPNTKVIATLDEMFKKVKKNIMTLYDERYDFVFTEEGQEFLKQGYMKDIGKFMGETSEAVLNNYMEDYKIYLKDHVDIKEDLANLFAFLTVFQLFIHPKVDSSTLEGEESLDRENIVVRVIDDEKGGVKLIEIDIIEICFSGLHLIPQYCIWHYFLLELDIFKEQWCRKFVRKALKGLDELFKITFTPESYKEQLEIGSFKEDSVFQYNQSLRDYEDKLEDDQVYVESSKTLPA